MPDTLTDLMALRDRLATGQRRLWALYESLGEESALTEALDLLWHCEQRVEQEIRRRVEQYEGERRP